MNGMKRMKAPAGEDKPADSPYIFATKNTENHQGCTKSVSGDETLQASFGPGVWEFIGNPRIPLMGGQVRMCASWAGTIAASGRSMHMHSR